jgi:hypothetical protein
MSKEDSSDEDKSLYAFVLLCIAFNILVLRLLDLRRLFEYPIVTTPLWNVLKGNPFCGSKTNFQLTREILG